MENMFRSASAFNQGLSVWNLGSVTTMENMFRSASAFNQGLSGWNVVSVAYRLTMRAHENMLGE